MKTVFISNYFSHHQKPLSDALWKGTEQQYTFMQTKEMDQERIRLGWGEAEIPCYVKNASSLMEEAPAEILLTGSAPEKLCSRQRGKNTLHFRYSERLLKNGPEYRKFLPRYIRYHLRNPKRASIYLLCAGAYTAADYAKFGLFRDRAYRWGYFPETVYYRDIQEQIAKKNKKKILWVGRFIEWKHPDTAINLADRLKQAGIPFELDMIGEGERKDLLLEKVASLGLEREVQIHGARTPGEVRAHMEGAGIFLFTSDHREGWGAVVNEAMNSGCAVVASHAAGSVPYLIRDGKNGIIYRSGDVESLMDKTVCLLADAELQKKLGAAAYQTIIREWNAETAAERLLHLAEALKKGEDARLLYKTGPCSPATLLREDWYHV
ncbi:MAG: glycosyltransferase family 4 protein [Eubacteriales bacterium]|nr:glycosyltransferase family 4 protein [Eubacteriales bacterium]